MQTPIEGQLLGGRYRVISTLASGGFGQTYVALDAHRPGSPRCVVKQLKPLNTGDEVLRQARRLFAIEAETLERLGHHPQIPRLLAYFEVDEFYLVMEYIDGHPLSQEMRSGQRWSEMQVCQLLKEVLTILAFVHSNGVIHRDIKPDNLIRRAYDQKLVLVDFGAVKQVRAPQPGQASSFFTIPVGTLGYLPSEQRDGHPRFNSDIYALGMMAVQALTGFNPGQIRSDPETLERVWEPYADASADLKHILSRMLRYHFRERYQSVEDVLNDLNPWIDRLSDPLPITQVASAETIKLPTGPVPAQPDALLTESEMQVPFVPFVAAEASNLPDPLPTQTLPTQTGSGSSGSGSSGSGSSGSGSSGSGSPAVTTSMAPVYPTAAVGSLSTAVGVLAPFTPGVEAEPRAYPVWRRKLWLWAGLVGMGTIVAVGSTLSHHWLQQQNYAQAQEMLQQAKSLQAEKQYDACVQRSRAISQDYSDLYDAAQALVDQCQLALAQQLAESGRFKDAIVAVGQVSAASPDYGQAQTLISQWSERILKLATDHLNRQGDLNAAIQIAQAIPRSSPIYQKAQDQIVKWRSDWANYQKLLEAAKQAQSEGKWQIALNQARKLPSAIPYWQQQARPIVDKAQRELNKPAPVPAPRASEVPAVYQAPAYQEPAYSEPAYSEPAYSEPAYQEPVYQEPAYSEPAYVPPAPAPAPAPVEVNDCPPGVLPPCV